MNKYQTNSVNNSDTVWMNSGAALKPAPTQTVWIFTETLEMLFFTYR